MFSASSETPVFKEIGASRCIELKNIKISGIPFEKRLDILLTGCIELEVAQDAIQNSNK